MSDIQRRVTTDGRRFRVEFRFRVIPFLPIWTSWDAYIGTHTTFIEAAAYRRTLDNQDQQRAERWVEAAS